MFDEQAVRDAVPRSAPGWALPHPNVFTQYHVWVLWGDGCDDDGNFIGYCPLHDQAMEVEASAEFNFRKGVMRCANDPSCHPGKRAMSLGNLAKRMHDAADS